MIQAVEGDDVMLDVAKSIRTRFLNCKDVNNVANRLVKEGYNVIYDIYEDLKINNNTIYRLSIYKDDRLLVQVLYTLRNDETDYKQYILYILY